MIITSYLKQLVNQESLTSQQMQQLIQAMLAPEAEACQVAAVLTALRTKGEAVDELHGIVQAMQQKMLRFDVDMPVLDIVGTGGDGVGSVNISTASAILAAACGVKVVKHGNRAVSSICGSADVLEALGISLMQSADQIKASVQKIGIGFCFAPNFHPILKQLREIRKSLGIPTCLNLVAPLLNPVSPQHYLFGVADKNMMQKLADVLAKLNIKRSVVFHGAGLDELTCLATTDVIVIEDGLQHEFRVEPESLGLMLCTLDDLKGGSADSNAKILRQTLSGEHTGLSDTLILNAGMACFVYGLFADLQQGVAHARVILNSGAALDLLNQWIECCGI